MKLLVSGSRECSNWEFVKARLDELTFKKKITAVIHGGAAGVDELAGTWARNNNIPEEVYLADWEKHGKSAGPIRNQQMLDEAKPTVAITFPSKNSKGTVHMIKILEKAGVPTIVHDVQV